MKTQLLQNKSGLTDDQALKLCFRHTPDYAGIYHCRIARILDDNDKPTNTVLWVHGQIQNTKGLNANVVLAVYPEA